jgi:hypothetical protein
MASAADNKFLLPEDMLYLATFTMGMAAFWLSGNITILVPAFKNSGLLSSSAGNLGFTAFIFGFGMFVVGFLITCCRSHPH